MHKRAWWEVVFLFFLYLQILTLQMDFLESSHYFDISIRRGVVVSPHSTTARKLCYRY